MAPPGRARNITPATTALSCWIPTAIGSRPSATRLSWCGEYVEISVGWVEFLRDPTITPRPRCWVSRKSAPTQPTKADLPQRGVDLLQRGRARAQLLLGERVERRVDRVEVLVQVFGLVVDVEQAGDNL